MADTTLARGSIDSLEVNVTTGLSPRPSATFSHRDQRASVSVSAEHVIDEALPPPAAADGFQPTNRLLGSPSRSPEAAADYRLLPHGPVGDAASAAHADGAANDDAVGAAPPQAQSNYQTLKDRADKRERRWRVGLFNLEAVGLAAGAGVMLAKGVSLAALLGQIAIPIPFVGAGIGAIIGGCLSLYLMHASYTLGAAMIGRGAWHRVMNKGVRQDRAQRREYQLDDEQHDLSLLAGPNSKRDHTQLLGAATNDIQRCGVAMNTLLQAVDDLLDDPSPQGIKRFAKQYDALASKVPFSLLVTVFHGMANTWEDQAKCLALLDALEQVVDPLPDDVRWNTVPEGHVPACAALLKATLCWAEGRMRSRFEVLFHTLANRGDATDVLMRFRGEFDEFARRRPQLAAATVRALIGTDREKQVKTLWAIVDCTVPSAEESAASHGSDAQLPERLLQAEAWANEHSPLYHILLQQVRSTLETDVPIGLQKCVQEYNAPKYRKDTVPIMLFIERQGIVMELYPNMVRDAAQRYLSELTDQELLHFQTALNGYTDASRFNEVPAGVMLDARTAWLAGVSKDHGAACVELVHALDSVLKERTLTPCGPV